ncbi:MAG: hypothetical protein HY554_14995 [Elusimicrobia bacterium]|nr:hypothetical protein [Elusimicrobiota bacterium]
MKAIVLALAAGVLVLPPPAVAEEPIDPGIYSDAPPLPESCGELEEADPGTLPSVVPMPPEGGMVQVELQENLGLGVQSFVAGAAEGGKTKIQVDSMMRYPGSMQEFVNFSVESKVYLAVKGEGEFYALRVAGSQLTGIKVKFVAHMPYIFYKCGRIPNPLDLRSIPIGTSILMKEEDLAEFDSEAYYRFLGGKDEFQETRGNAVGIERIGPSAVRLLAGPTEGVAENLKLFLGLGKEFVMGPAKVEVKGGAGLSSRRSLSQYRLKTAILDVTTPAGQAAFTRFFFLGSLGRLPEAGDGVLKLGTIERVSYLQDTGLFVQASLALKANAGQVKVDMKLGGEGALNFGQYQQSSRVTEYDTGERERDESVRSNDRLVAVRAALDGSGAVELDENGVEREKVYVMLEGAHPASAAYLWAAMTGEENKQFEGNQDIQLTFRADEARELRARAVRVGEDQCARLNRPLDYCDPFIPGNQFLYLLYHCADDPLQVAAAFSKAFSSGLIAESLLHLYVAELSAGGGPVAGKIDVRSSSTQ